jgi:hypothetical protein
MVNISFLLFSFPYTLYFTPLIRHQAKLLVQTDRRFIFSADGIIAKFNGSYMLSLLFNLKGGW